MNVTIENLAPCRKVLRVDIDAKTVDDTFETVTEQFGKQVKLPGFRPGKVPKTVITKNFAKELEAEVRKRIVSDSYQKALREHKLHVVGSPEVKEGNFGRNQNFTFDITVETAPDFELPEYKGLPAKKEMRTVTEEDIQRALNVLRERLARYEDVDRAAQEGDIVVVNYTGTSDGKPLTEIAPTARGITKQQGFWMEIKPGSFIPGFTEQLVGVTKGEKKTIEVEFPQDFVAQQLSGHKGVYEVEVVQVKQKQLPELNDDLAKQYGAESVEKLREGVTQDLQKELEFTTRRNIRNQVLSELSNRVQCELPETLVQGETRSIVYDIVMENQQRGVPKEILQEKSGDIFNLATNNAKEKLKIAFLLGRIAEKESIKVSQEELMHRLVQIASERQTRPEKLIKELQKNDGFAPIHEQLLMQKVVDFLEQHAAIEEVPAAPAQQ